MEQETYVRWLLPGSLFASTFVLVGLLSGLITPASLAGDESAIGLLTSLLVTGVPVVGFLSETLVHWLFGGYDGRRCPLPILGRLLPGHWSSRARSRAKAEILRSVPASGFLHRRFRTMESDTAYGAISAGGVLHGLDPMPEPLRGNIRRRWTRWWVCAQGATAIVLAQLVLGICGWRTIVIHDGARLTWLTQIGIPSLLSPVTLALLTLLAVAFGLLQIGWRSRQNAWDLEYMWLAEALRDSQRDDSPR